MLEWRLHQARRLIIVDHQYRNLNAVIPEDEDWTLLTQYGENIVIVARAVRFDAVRHVGKNAPIRRYSMYIYYNGNIPQVEERVHPKRNVKYENMQLSARVFTYSNGTMT